MEKFKQLLKHCKCGVHLTINEHRDFYQSAEQRLEDLDCMECPPKIECNIRKIMIETNTIIDLQFYPDTPIGSYSIYHHDIDMAIDEAMECLRSERCQAQCDFIINKGL